MQMKITLNRGMVMTNQVKQDGGWIRKVYLYLTMLITLLMVIGGSVGVVMAVADIVAPTPYYMSFEEYRHMHTVKQGEGRTEIGGEAEVDEQTLRAQYEEMIRLERERSVERAKNSLIKSLAWVLVPLPVFIYFQRQVRKGGGNKN
ncbi:hypothetical protein GCM10010965_23630 [Caldalkalibacillus thermarum]|nr:hypothetical protein GCM10010965_23630 [Caldalkalibacillus thermarum]